MDFIGPLRRGTLNAVSEAVECNESCSAAMTAGLMDVTAKRVCLRDPASWTLAATKSLALETPADFGEQGQVCHCRGCPGAPDYSDESNTDALHRCECWAPMLLVRCVYCRAPGTSPPPTWST